MSVTLSIRVTAEARRKVMVVSHERSGTHFLMNALEANFGYLASEWLNLDYELGINFHSPSVLQGFFGSMDGRHVLNILKSHHQLGFFAPLLPAITKEIQIFYVFRHPGDVMVSLQRFLNTRPCDEGPRCETAAELMRMEPEGAMLRYQKRGLPDMVARWRAHVEPWVEAAAVHPGITLVRYEDLNLRFEETVRHLAGALGLPLGPIRLPDPKRNVIEPGPGRVLAYRDVFQDEDLQFLEERGGPLLARLYPEYR